MVVVEQRVAELDRGSVSAARGQPLLHQPQRGEGRADRFFKVNAWRSVAESLTTGARVLVTGRLQSRNWETEDGAKRSAVEIEAEEVAASLRWATAKLTKATKAAAADWAPDEEPAGEAPAE